jgi:hypothetical protein
MKIFRIIVLIAVLAGGGWWLYAHPELLSRWSLVKQAIEEKTAELIPADIRKSITLPEPLRKDDGKGYALTRAGVIKFTNAARAENGGLPALKESAKLDQAAVIRMEDMFKEQYFAHESPTGRDAEYGAKKNGYDYIALGENIALGRFNGDADLVTAWMNSPGHRKNILSTHYTEIGVAVGEGTFEGKKVWIGVQIFGRPMADCPQPSPELKTKIDALKAKLDSLGARADSLRVELENTPRPKTEAQRDAYNAKVDEYNRIIQDMNTAGAQIKILITEYNDQVARTNACIGT